MRWSMLDAVVTNVALFQRSSARSAKFNFQKEVRFIDGQ